METGDASFSGMSDLTVFELARTELRCYSSAPPGNVKRAAWDAYTLAMNELGRRGYRSVLEALAGKAPEPGVRR